ncbi:MAG: hypothetical protein J0I36_08335 [Pandoraea sp.]|uniref:hypothetical protein n=1 Tax=Pandoraea sp. 64-18 TaxID=1895806 RepID=UPI00096991EC|nr:hypothetical protein [Pandoraea sp. 64-18]MBN9115285.1 hypothetical protein [Pandoraea sp.]OJY20751.1 MAG: hypothetical protein BGP02_09865 [Pandoraea sp. 64-18]
MDPATASALIGGASNVLGRALQTPPAGPSTALGTASMGGSIDFSGMTVATGGATANGAPHNQSSGLDLTTIMVIGAIAVVVLRVVGK